MLRSFIAHGGKRVGVSTLNNNSTIPARVRFGQSYCNGSVRHPALSLGGTTNSGMIKSSSQLGVRSQSKAFMETTTVTRQGSLLLRCDINHGGFIIARGGNNPSIFFNTRQYRGGGSSMPKSCHYQQVLHTQLGSMTHFSSFGGGGGRRPNPFFSANRMSQGAGLAGAAALMFGKGKYVLGALKLSKFASLWSMVASVGAYSMIFGLPYAAGMVGLTLIHEAGHGLVMMRYGIPFSPALFIPFVGAIINMKGQPQDAYQNAMIAFGGPVLGSMGTGAVAVTASMTDSQLLYALADFGYMVNLFNLIPIGQMDGGRITDALSPYSGVVGLGIGGSLLYTGHVTSPIMYLVMMAGGYQTFQRFYYPHNVPPSYYRISTQQKVGITAGYFGLIGAILAAMAANNRDLRPPEVIQRTQELSFDMR